MMKTATISLGNKNYQAAPLTVAETVLVSRTLAAMGKGLAAEADDAFAAIANSIETLTDVLLAALRKLNPEVTADELRQFTPNEIMLAIGTLIPASCDPAALSGVVMDSYQRHKGN